MRPLPTPPAPRARRARALEWRGVCAPARARPRAAAGKTPANFRAPPPPRPGWSLGAGGIRVLSHLTGHPPPSARGECSRRFAQRPKNPSELETSGTDVGSPHTLGAMSAEAASSPRQPRNRRPDQMHRFSKKSNLVHLWASRPGSYLQRNLWVPQVEFRQMLA